MKKILVPCDFSDQAINAFRVAVDIAKQSKGEVHLVNVVELPVMHDTVLMPVMAFEETMLADMRANAEKQFKKLKEKHAKEGPKIKTKTEFGSVSPMLTHYIKDEKIDLVVMGTHGASGLRELVIGSNAEKIVRTSPVPVITVKKYVKVAAIKNIVFPNTLSDKQEDLLMQIKALQFFFKAKLHVVWINTPSNFTRDTITKERLEEFAKRFMLKDYTLNIFNDPFEESGVINFAAMIKAEMIAMGTHGRKGLSHIVSGSVAEDVVNHVDIPIWTYAIKK